MSTGGAQAKEEVMELHKALQRDREDAAEWRLKASELERKCAELERASEFSVCACRCRVIGVMG